MSLPVSKSRIKSNCFHVECYNNKEYVAICVTAEGSIRYWPSIFNEFLCIEGKCDLAANDEAAFVSLISVEKNVNAKIFSIKFLFELNKTEKSISDVDR